MAKQAFRRTSSLLDFDNVTMRGTIAALLNTYEKQMYEHFLIELFFAFVLQVVLFGRYQMLTGASQLSLVLSHN